MSVVGEFVFWCMVAHFVAFLVDLFSARPAERSP